MKDLSLFDTVIIELEQLAKLPEYSVTDPTGVSIGKKWRCSTEPKRQLEDEQMWLLCQYVQDPDKDRNALIVRRLAMKSEGEPHVGYVGNPHGNG